MTGSIPPELSGAISLTHLSLSNNQITGAIPGELGALSDLKELLLDHNQLSGTVPSGLGTLGNLERLVLNNNQLGGVLPPELGNLERLRQFDIRANLFTGAVPAEFGQLTNIAILNISNNAFSGPLDPTLVSLASSNSSSWFLFNLGYNSLSASDPSVAEYFSTKDPDWQETQTIPPTNLQASQVTSSTVSIKWQIIPYTGDGGYYEVSYALSPDGLFTVDGTTSDKTSSTYTIEGLLPITNYWIRLRTFTPAHAAQINSLWSSYSLPLEVLTTSNHQTFEPLENPIYLPIIIR